MLKVLVACFYMDRFSIMSLVRRQWWVIIILAGLVSGATYWFDSQKEPSFYGSFTVNVDVKRNYPKTDQLILQPSASEDLRAAIATTQSWIHDPYYAQKALRDAGVETGELSLKEYASQFQIVAPVDFSSTYQVQYTSSTASEVQKVTSSLQKVLEEVQAAQGGGELTLDMNFTDTTVTSKSSGMSLVPIAGLLIGLFFGLIVAALIDKPRRS